MSNIDRYNQYISNKNNVWKERFTYMGLTGETPNYKTTIINFEKETNTISNIGVLKNVQSLFNKVRSIAEKYINWCKTKDNYSEEELKDLGNFFVGCIGEYFFTCFLNDVKCLMIKEKKGNIYHRFDFINVCPRLIGENDFGVDLTGYVSYKDKSYDCAFQVKFWNPYIDTMFTNELASGVFADAICNNYINIEDRNNVFVCWLGADDRVSKYLKKNEKLYRYIQFIDMDVLNNTINNQMPLFWNTFKIELDNIKNI